MNEELSTIVKNWQAAYRLANQKEPPQVEYHRGWFRIDHMRLRKSQLIEATEWLLKRIKA